MTRSYFGSSSLFFLDYYDFDSRESSTKVQSNRSVYDSVCELSVMNQIKYIVTENDEIEK